MLIAAKNQFFLTKELLSVCLFAALLALLTSPILAQTPGAAATTPDTRPATQPRTFINYFLPTPPQGELVSEAWGATNVLPPDIQNGLEDITMKKYCCWDGHGSKVIVVPFDGAALDRDLESTANSPKR